MSRVEARRRCVCLALLVAWMANLRFAVPGFVGQTLQKPVCRQARLMLRAAPQKAEEGLRAWIEYTGTNEDGKVFATIVGKEPLDFVIGEEGSWLEEAVMDLAVGESREVKLGEDRPIYGSWKQELVKSCPIDKIPAGAQVGSMLTPKGGDFPWKVVEINETAALLDTNHPLAGQATTMSVKLLRLEELAASELVEIERITPGDGTTFPQRGDTLSVHYTGTLASDGAQFDSSRGGEPLEFQIGFGKVIAGWDRGIRKLSLGERAILRIPANLGYGAKGAGRDIPPNADLVFDVELLSIN